MDLPPSGKRSLSSENWPTHCTVGTCEYPDREHCHHDQHSTDASHNHQTTAILDSQPRLNVKMGDSSIMPLEMLPSHHSSEPNFGSHWTLTDEDLKPRLHDGTFGYVPLPAYGNILPSDHLTFHPPLTVEPRMTLRNHTPCCAGDESPQSVYNISYFGHADDSPTLDDVSQPGELTPYDIKRNLSDHDHSPIVSDASSSSIAPSGNNQVNDNVDKPYARLIYEAMMQAPNHRMALADIYKWFIQNTTKPQESGTNGWQNSIRHNLSMNQAFANDRSAYCQGKGRSRKANSVWYLTEHAIKYGIQSTTRYRKTSAPKKRSPSQAATTQRQKSGARGGRATHRSALRLRRQAENSKLTSVNPLTNATASLPQGGLGHGGSTLDQTFQEGYPPLTPADSLLEPFYALPISSYANNTEEPFKAEHNNFSGNDLMVDDYCFLPTESSTPKEVSKIEEDWNLGDDRTTTRDWQDRQLL